MTTGAPPIAPLIMRIQAMLAEALLEGMPAAGFPGIRPTHCQVLRGLEPGESRLTDLAAAARMTKQSMVAVVDHLESAGYVERVADGTDGRVKAIRLTPDGRRAAEAIGDIGARIEQEWAQRIGHQRLDELREALAEICR